MYFEYKTREKYQKWLKKKVDTIKPGIHMRQYLLTQNTLEVTWNTREEFNSVTK